MRPLSRTSLLVLGVIITVEFAASFCSPLLPLIRSHFGVDESWVQMTVGFYLLGLGGSALFYGPLSDAWGRRPMILFGLGVFSAASLCCMYAQSEYGLIVSRLIQGMGAGVAWAVGNAAIKDVAHGYEYTRSMNLIHIIVGFIPAIAPICGGYWGDWWGWRVSFLLVFVIALLMLATLSMVFHESIQRTQSFSFKKLTRGYQHVILQPLYCRYMIVKVLMVMLLFVDAANLSLIYIENLSVPLSYFGYYVALGFSAYLLGGWFCHHWVQKLGNDRLISWGLSSACFSTIILLAALMVGIHSAVWIHILRIPLYIAWGLIFGNATACIVSPFPKHAGAASALMIAMEMLFSFFGIYICGVFYDGTMMPLVQFTLVTILIASLGFYGLRNYTEDR